MFHRGFFFGRFIMLLLLIGGMIAVGRGLYRSGFEQGFVRGMAFSAGDGQSAPDSAARPPVAPPVYDEWGHSGWGRGGIGPFEGGGFLVFAIAGFAVLMIMKAIGRRHWAAHHGWGHYGPGHHAHWGNHGRGHGHHPHGCRPRGKSDEVGPEKQPEDFI